MTQKEKELLLKDLCARLPYGVVIQDKCLSQLKSFLPNKECDTLIDIDVYSDILTTIDGSVYEVDDINPYLFPLSSMTEEQRKEYEDALTYHDYIAGGWTIAKSFDNEYIIPYWFVDFCNKNNFDYRGLIPMGLAIDCTNLNIY